MERVVAVIPARAGSVGVPRKNLRTVGGVPLVARAVASARAASRVDRVVVSTDGAEIASAASAAGADVVMRPPELSTGTASSESAVLHALDVLAERGVDPAVVVLVQATSPFTRPDDIDLAVERVCSGECDTVFAAVRTHAFLWGADAAGRVRGLNHDPAFRPMRQDREPQYQETGAFYVMDAAGLRRFGLRFFGRIGVALIADPMDIDTEHDLLVADALARVHEADPASTPDHRLAASAPARHAVASARSAAPVSAVAATRTLPPHDLDPVPAIDGAHVEASGIARIEAVVTDFDGVHTDDTVRVDQNGVESVRVSRRDGLGVRMLRGAGVPVLILSTETNPVVAARAAKLGVPVLQGIDDKAAALVRWAADAGVQLEHVAYLGNDVNDLGALGSVGWPFAVADAHPRTLAAARRVLRSPGGAGAVRELAEIILEQKRTMP